MCGFLRAIISTTFLLQYDLPSIHLTVMLLQIQRRPSKWKRRSPNHAQQTGAEARRKHKNTLHASKNKYQSSLVQLYLKICHVYSIFQIQLPAGGGVRTGAGKHPICCEFCLQPKYHKYWLTDRKPLIPPKTNSAVGSAQSRSKRSQ
jgi:hypothetical protein